MKFGYQSPLHTPELTDFRETVRRFIAEEIAPHDEQWRKQKFVDRSVWLKAGELGLLLPDVPEEYGGVGADFSYEAVVYEEQFRAGATGFGKAVHSIAAHYILKYGTEEQKLNWLPRMGTGAVIGAIAMTEPGAGSDLQGIKTTARREGEHYIVNGTKTFITNGYNADLIILVAKTDPAAGSKGISLLLFDARNTPGFRVGRMLDKIGLQGSDTCELFFDDCRVPVGNLIGVDEGRGFYQMMEQLPYERTVIAVSAMGAIEGALEQTLAYVKDRKAFGKTVLEFQHTRFTMADMKTEETVARTFADRLIGQMVDGSMDSVTASMGKAWLTDLQCSIIDRCLQLHGGYGYMMEYPIGRMYIDARVQKIYGGTNEIMKELISRSL